MLIQTQFLKLQSKHLLCHTTTDLFWLWCADFTGLCFDIITIKSKQTLTFSLNSYSVYVAHSFPLSCRVSAIPHPTLLKLSPPSAALYFHVLLLHPRVRDVLLHTFWSPDHEGPCRSFLQFTLPELSCRFWICLNIGYVSTLTHITKIVSLCRSRTHKRLPIYSCVLCWHVFCFSISVEKWLPNSNID